MIEIVHTWNPKWSYFTIASLIDKEDEEFRLHLYVDEKHFDDLPVNWIFDNITNVKIYESYWQKDFAARAIQHLRLHWKERGLHKRILYASGNRIFLKHGWNNEIPDESFFVKKLSHLSRKKTFVGHKQFSAYYGMLDFAKADMPANWDTNFFLINYDKLKTLHDNELFYERGFYNDYDSRVLASTNKYFFTKLHEAEHGVLPRYMSGKSDLLIEWDALPSKEFLNYNVMLRKCFTVALPTTSLESNYTDLTSGKQLSFPWELYANLIDRIPVNLRDTRLCENLMIKTARQKSTASQLIKVGYRLGKL
jgi:hypothetical protein